MLQSLGEGADAAHCGALYAHGGSQLSQASLYPLVGAVVPQAAG